MQHPALTRLHFLLSFPRSTAIAPFQRRPRLVSKGERMVISRLLAPLLATVCAAGLLVGEIHAGQCHPDCQEPEMVLATYCVADLVIRADAPATGAKTTEETL